MQCILGANGTIGCELSRLLPQYTNTIRQVGGAWRLMKMGIVVKQMKTVETLGSATVICTDKTGTLTENKMSIAGLYNAQTEALFLTEDLQKKRAENEELISYAMWSSEPIPFDPMEVSIHAFYKENAATDRRAEFNMVHEYPLSGKPPMMTVTLTSSKRFTSSQSEETELSTRPRLRPGGWPAQLQK